MKGVPIKFRGIRMDSNGFAYGDLEHRYNGREIWIGGWQVKPSSVAQLVGYDAAGNEIYEGDKIAISLIDGEEATGTCAIQAGAMSNLLMAVYGFEDCDNEFTSLEDLISYKITKVVNSYEHQTSFNQP